MPKKRPIKESFKPEITSLQMSLTEAHHKVNFAQQAISDELSSFSQRETKNNVRSTKIRKYFCALQSS
jgi:hypothetical protein